MRGGAGSVNERELRRLLVFAIIILVIAGAAVILWQLPFIEAPHH